jgi:hypothetical protein
VTSILTQFSGYIDSLVLQLTQRVRENRTDPAIPHTILVFYGYSGDGTRSGSFPDGVDRNLTFKLSAETAATTLGRVYTKDTIKVIQAWTKSEMMSALSHASPPIRQVHVFCHGDADWLSLAYHYADGARLLERAQRINSANGSESQKGMETLTQEDALVAGYLNRALDPAVKAEIRGKHAPGASWQIWGCFAGYSPTRFTGNQQDPDLDQYFKRLNFGQTDLDGIAVEIAKSFGVACTAAQGNGLEFWLGKPDGKIVRSTFTTPPTKPFWLWLTSGSDWVTYDASGQLQPEACLFGRNRSPAALPSPRPPLWLTNGYWTAMPKDF